MEEDAAAAAAPIPPSAGAVNDSESSAQSQEGTSDPLAGKVTYSVKDKPLPEYPTPAEVANHNAPKPGQMLGEGSRVKISNSTEQKKKKRNNKKEKKKDNNTDPDNFDFDLDNPRILRSSQSAQGSNHNDSNIR